MCCCAFYQYRGIIEKMLIVSMQGNYHFYSTKFDRLVKILLCKPKFY